MKKFWKNTKGSITVMVTLIMIPTIFFNGFLVDMSRLKLMGNQAAMAADSYGDTVLSMYDNVLKELYGLFAVTQDEESLEKLKELDSYVKSSFNPNENTVSPEYLTAIFGETEYTGVMPYKNADVALSYEFVEGANLSEYKVMGTQIGDFMKFRIAQTFMDDDSFMEVFEQIKTREGDADAIDQRNVVQEKAETVLEAVESYYNILTGLEPYPSCPAEFNKLYDAARKNVEEIAKGDSYKRYYAYFSDQKNIDAAVAKKAKKDETLSDEEEELCEIYEEWRDDLNAAENSIAHQLAVATEALKNDADSEIEAYEKYSTVSYSLKEQAGVIKENIGELQSAYNELQSILDSEEKPVSDAVKTEMKAELEDMEKLFDGGGGEFSAQKYIGLADKIFEKNVTEVDRAERDIVAIESVVSGVNEITDAYKDCLDVPDWPDRLKDDWYDFTRDPEYKEFYGNLRKIFEGGKRDEKSEKKKDEAEESLKKAENGIEDEKKPEVRDIPEMIEIGGNDKSGFGSSIKGMIKTAKELFSFKDLAEAGTAIITKYYTVQYDFNMFSSRLTDKKIELSKKNQGEADSEPVMTSLTGYEISRNINYLYGAELEYILAGHKDSSKNLDYTRNCILGFRAVANFSSTYSIKEINTPIKVIQNAVSVYNPILGYAVAGALRLAIAGLETYEDWKVMMDGGKVALFKRNLNDLALKEDIMKLVDADKKGNTTESKKGIELGYEDYLTIMLMFMTPDETVVKRTGDLITLNVNSVRQGIGADEDKSLEKLEFKMENAYTAVNATCAVHMDFVVMPDGFARRTVSEETYEELEEFEKNYYKFTVTRGY